MDSPEENTGNKHTKSRSESVQRMFLVIIAAYVLSYILPLVILILSSLSEGQTIAWIYFAQFVFLNHIVNLNPFIYGYFDKKI
jgi:cellobiose-specific phosphotransferase system component IIC